MTSDNVFGTAREDALRRDFTINGLFYNIADFSVIDYVGGLDDLEAGLIRTIGDAGHPLPRGPRPHDAGGGVREPAGFRDHPRRLRGDPEPPQGNRQVGAAPRHRGALPVAEGRARADDLPPACGRSGSSTSCCPSSPRSCGRPTPSIPTAPAISSGRCSTFWTPSGGAAGVYDDAVLFSLFFLPVVRARVREAAPDGEPSPACFRRSSKTSSRPIAIRMSLPHAVSHRIKQALAIVGKLSHRPDSASGDAPARVPGGVPGRSRALRAARDGDGTRRGARPRVARPLRARRKDPAGLRGRPRRERAGTGRRAGAARRAGAEADGRRYRCRAPQP